MKTLSTTLVVAAMVLCPVFVFGNKNKNVKKLPSRVAYFIADTVVDHNDYFYDEQNRLIRLTSLRGHSVDITYNSVGLPDKVKGLSPSEIDIVYKNNGRKIIIASDTLWLNEKGQIEKTFRSHPEMFTAYTYNSDGNIIKHSMSKGWEVNLSYTDIPVNAQYVNTPDWFLLWLDQGALVHPFHPNGYLPLQTYFANHHYAVNYAYQLDMDNYVTEIKTSYNIKIDTEVFFKIDYVLAK